MSKDFKEASTAFFVLFSLLYAACSFVQLTMDPTDWTAGGRTVLVIGIVIIIVYLIFVFAK